MIEPPIGHGNRRQQWRRSGNRSRRLTRYRGAAIVAANYQTSNGHIVDPQTRGRKDRQERHGQASVDSP